MAELSENGTRWGLRTLALALAILAWFFFSFEDRERLAETTLEPLVNYNPPRGFTILNPEERVRVQVSGSPSRISTINPFQVSVMVDLSDNTEAGTVEALLGAENVDLPEGIEFVSITPNLLALTLDEVVEDLKPVDVRLVGEPAAGAIAQTPEVLPPRVLVRGPRSRLSQVQALTTSPVSLDGHALDFEEPVAVVSPDPLVTILQPVVVTVRVPMEIPEIGNSGESP